MKTIKEFGLVKTARRGFAVQPTNQGKTIKEFGLVKTARRGFAVHPTNPGGVPPERGKALF
jgi:hypothetical protein